MKGRNDQIHFPKEMWAIIDFCSGLFLVLIRGKIQENELILKKFFKFNEVRALGIEERNQFFV